MGYSRSMSACHYVCTYFTQMTAWLSRLCVTPAGACPPSQVSLMKGLSSTFKQRWVVIMSCQPFPHAQGIAPPLQRVCGHGVLVPVHLSVLLAPVHVSSICYPAGYILHMNGTDLNYADYACPS